MTSPCTEGFRGYRSRSILAWPIACFLAIPSHYPKQCLRRINGIDFSSLQAQQGLSKPCILFNFLKIILMKYIFWCLTQDFKYIHMHTYLQYGSTFQILKWQRVISFNFPLPSLIQLFWLDHRLRWINRQSRVDDSDNGAIFLNPICH